MRVREYLSLVGNPEVAAFVGDLGLISEDDAMDEFLRDRAEFIEEVRDHQSRETFRKSSPQEDFCWKSDPYVFIDYYQLKLW